MLFNFICINMNKHLSSVIKMFKSFLWENKYKYASS